jgi:hypothetical protein
LSEVAASKAVVGRRLSYTHDRIAYGGRLGTQGTDPVRREDIREDAGERRSPATRKFPKYAKNVKTAEIPDSRGVWRQKVPCGMPASDPHRWPDPSSTATIFWPWDPE